jgi:hypothetical protein
LIYKGLRFFGVDFRHYIFDHSRQPRQLKAEMCQQLGELFFGTSDRL